MGTTVLPIGQHEVKACLGNAVQNLSGHAFIFLGPKGVGKHLFAKAFVKGILCLESNELGGCNECDSCNYMNENTHPDYREIVPGKGDKTIKIEAVRKLFCSDTGMFPQKSDKKAYYIDGDYLNEQSQNAILKTIEEIPEYAYVVLATSSSQHILPTLMSRMIPVHFRRNTPDEIRKILLDSGIEESDKINSYSKLSGGIPESALDLARDEIIGGLRDKLINILSDIPKRSISDLLTEDYKFFDENKTYIRNLIAMIQIFMRDLVIYKTYGENNKLINEDKAEEIIKFCNNFDFTVKSVKNSSDATLNASKALELNVGFENCISNMLISIRKEFADA